MAEGVIGKDAGHHGFTYGDGADANTGIMATFGEDFGFVSVLVNGVSGRED